MKKIRLLTVDDDKFIRHLVNKTLRSEYSSFEVTEADNGRRAQAILQRHSFDLVLCDWEMPEMTGLQLLKWVRSDENLKEQPFILVTSLDTKENVVRAVESGVNDYITKPFTPEQLLTKVMQQLVKSGRLTQEEADNMGRKERVGAAGGAELLTAGTANTAKRSTKGGAGKVRKPASAKPPLPKALLMQGDKRAAANIKDISQREALLLVKRADFFPELASQVQLGLVGGPDEAPKKVSLRAYVSSLQLAERNPNAENSFIRVQFLKPDAEAAKTLSQLIDP